MRVLLQLINVLFFVRATFCSDVLSSFVIFSWVSAAFYCRWSCFTHKTKQKTLLHVLLVVKGSKSQWRKFFDICCLPDRIVANEDQELMWMSSLWRNLLILGSRYCSANATKSAFPARKQRELWCILSQKRGCVTGRGRSHCKLQAAKPCVTVKPLLDFSLCLLYNKRA